MTQFNLSRWKFILAGAVSLATVLTSCVATDVVQPQVTEETDTVVVRISHPEDTESRAESGYKLRYVAKIFQGSNADAWDSALQRQEIIDGEDGNRIVFKVSADKNYAIMVFADYIPKDFTADEKGCYQDYFYNTRTYDKRIVQRTTPGSDADLISPALFNNPNYDAFFGIATFKKEEAEKIVDLTLRRTAAQVIFRDESDSQGPCQVIVNKIGLVKNFDMDRQLSIGIESSEANKNRGDILLENIPTLSDQDRDLFYFYTLADQLSSDKEVSVQFKLAYDDKTIEIDRLTGLRVNANHRTIVKGHFLPDSEENLTPGEDSKSGDVILNLSVNYSWETQEF